VKIDSSTGNVSWEHVLSESTGGVSSAYEVVHATPAGGLITGGVTNAEQGGLEGFKSYGNPSSDTAFVAYYGPDLLNAVNAPSSPTWRRDLSDSLTAKGVRPIGATGDFLVLTSAVQYPNEAILKKLDVQGVILWSKSYPTRGEPTDLSVLANAGALKGFAFCGHGGKSFGILDSYLTALDLNGTVTWTREFGDPVGGVDKFAGLGAGNPKLIYDESWGIMATAYGGMIVASGTGIEGCDPWKGTDGNQTRISILNECVADPRTDWRGMITKFDENGSQVWQRVDSFLSPDGEPTQSSACEYVSITPDGKLLSVNDEAFGVGLLVLEAEVLSSSSSTSSSSNALAVAGTVHSNGWRSLEWFGEYFPTGSGWSFHAQHGWIYPVGSTLDSLWYWDTSLGWFWTNQTLYPFVYRHESKGWFYYQRESKNPRRFYDYVTKAWLENE